MMSDEYLEQVVGRREDWWKGYEEARVTGWFVWKCVEMAISMGVLRWQAKVL